jgi:hypothetical protein
VYFVMYLYDIACYAHNIFETHGMSLVELYKHNGTRNGNDKISNACDQSPYKWDASNDEKGWNIVRSLIMITMYADLYTY